MGRARFDVAAVALGSVDATSHVFASRELTIQLAKARAVAELAARRPDRAAAVLEPFLDGPADIPTASAVALHALAVSRGGGIAAERATVDCPEAADLVLVRRGEFAVRVPFARAALAACLAAR